MKSMKWWMGDYKNYRVGIAIFIVLFAFVFTAGCSIFPKEAEEEEIPVIEPPKISKKPEMTVTKGDILIKAKGSGQVYSNTEEYLYFMGSDEEDQGSGQPGNQTETFRIKKIYVEPGENVKAGQVLAELVTKDLDLKIEQSENKLKIEEQKLILKLRDEVITDEERIEQEQLKSDFRDLQIAHQKLVRQMQNSQIVAPFDGQVASLFYNSGDQVKAFDTVMLLIDTNDLVVGVRMTETDQKALFVGQEATVEISGVNEPLTGKILKMPSGKKEDNNDDFFGGGNNKPKDERKEMVLISVDKLPPDVKRGAVANASVVLQKKENVVKIPLSFLQTYGDRNYVVVTDDQGKREVDVELGLRSATEVEIVSGISAGIKLIGR